MIEILPNWHPIFVHFTIALLSMAVVFYVLRLVLPAEHRYQPALTLLAKTNLYLGVGFSFITALAGWFAYNSVNHDTPSHLAMTEHRNIAIITISVFVILALWSLFLKNKAGILFVLLMITAGGLLSVTGWMGAEAVYRYGLGVLSMPKVSGEGHAHQHAGDQGHGDKPSPTKPTIASEVIQSDHDNTPHDHPAVKAKPSVTSHDETPHAH